LYLVDVGNVFDVSNVNAPSDFRVDHEDGATIYFRNVGNTTIKVEAAYTSGTSVTLRTFSWYRTC
jgi:putative component of toxin-antitoxin plasmid stabilization module